MFRKRLTTEEFVKRTKTLWKDALDFSFSIYTSYNCKVVVVCKKHGPFLRTPQNLLRERNFTTGYKNFGCLACSVESKKKPRISVNNAIKRLKETHGDVYDYSKVAETYKGMQKKVVIICKKHGEFEQRCCAHAKGAGCPTCGSIKQRNSHRLKLDEIIYRAKQKHGNKYDYSYIKYIDSKTPIKIVCRKHGAFFPTPANFIIAGTGCPGCAKEVTNKIFKEKVLWSYSTWEKVSRKSKRFDIYKVYIMQLNQDLYKIGRTYRKISYRLADLPYPDAKVLQVVAHKNARVICELEAKLLNACKDYQTTPSKCFGGGRECFSNVEPAHKIIETLKTDPSYKLLT